VTSRQDKGEACNRHSLYPVQIIKSHRPLNMGVLIS